MSTRLFAAFLAFVVALAPAGLTAAATDPDYRIGVDDVLSITVWDNKDLDQVVFVRPDGKISLPLLGEVAVGGLTVGQVTAMLTEMYEKTVKVAQVSVDVKEIRSRPIFFIGGVGKPGPMQLTQDLRLLQAIATAGGVAATADLESAYVFRKDKRIPIDFVKLLKHGDPTQNIPLEPGDTIVVPVADQVYVQGEVKSPGGFKFTKDLTVVKLIAMAGGFTMMAAPKRVTLVRSNGDKKESFKINVTEMMAEPGKGSKDIALQPNDIIIVPQRIF